MTLNTSQHNDQTKALAQVLRDKYLADARQCMKVVRQIERDYGLEPAQTKGKER